MSNRLDSLTVGTVNVTSAANLPDSSIRNANIAAGSVDSGKLGQEPALNYYQAPGSDIATATADLHVCNVAGVVDSVQAAVTGVIASGVHALVHSRVSERSVTVDILKSTGGGAFASILTSVLTLNSSNTIRVPVDATITTTAFAAADLYRITVTQVAGTTGTRPQGLIVTVVLKKVSNP